MAAGVPVTEALRWLDLIGVLANAVLGGVIARSARLDVVGFATLAILSGLGGGIIRDTLLQQGTPVALTDYSYLLTALAGAAIAFLVKVEGRVWDQVWPLLDALALGCWAAAGAQKTLAFGLGWCEIAPGEFAVLTVGSVQAGTKSNVIPDHAVIELNIRSYGTQTRDTILAAINRIVTAECQASGSPKGPEFELYDQFPITDNDQASTERVAAVFAEFFGDRATTLPPQTASEDFSDIPNGLGVPYTYWGIGGTDPDTYRTAEQAGRIAQDIPVNHAASFAPVIQPTLDTGTQALVVAALAWLGK